MKTHEIISVLKTNTARILRFALPNGHMLPVGYHITEVMNVQIDGVDCGGRRSQWQETIIQVWEPSNPAESKAITAEKALGILEKVQSIRSMNMNSEAFFEVEDESGTAIVYRPLAIAMENQELVVQLGPRKTQCKPKAQTLTISDDGASSGCCVAKSDCCS